MHWDAPRWAALIMASLAIASTSLLTFGATL
jgi:hypothetical protein